MFKKLLILVAFVAVGLASYGIARAYFSSKAPATGTATFQAGTIDINIQQHPGYNSVPFSMTNWMPGQTQDVVFDVVNSSTVPVNLVGSIDGTWGGTLGDKEVHVMGGYYWDGSDWAPLNIDSHGNIVYDDPSGKLGAGETATMKITAKFEETAGNEFQGETYTATLKVLAVQVGGELPSEF